MSTQHQERASALRIDADVIVDDDRWENIPGVSDAIAKALNAIARQVPAEKLPPSAATILLSSDAHVQRLNAQFRKKDQPTNVLSFPAAPGLSGPEEAIYLGDVILAFETIEREAQADSKSSVAHTQHLAVHGVLHLLGYDHETETEADIMEALETRILISIGLADPYAA